MSAEGARLNWVAVALWLTIAAFGAPRIELAHLLGDKAAHAIVFAVLGVLVAGAVAKQTRGPALSVAFVALAFCVGVGAVDELLQSGDRTRTADFGDLTADTVGAAFGITIRLAFGRIALLLPIGSR